MLLIGALLPSHWPQLGCTLPNAQALCSKVSLPVLLNWQEMGDIATDLAERVGLEGRYLDGLGDDQDSDLAGALASLVPEGSDLSPVHPEDLLSVIPVFIAQATKEAEAAPGGDPDACVLGKGRPAATGTLHMFRNTTATCLQTRPWPHCRLVLQQS